MAQGLALDALDDKTGQQVVDLEDFFENGGVGLHVVDSDGRILRANKAELEMLGYGVEDYVGHHITEFHVDGHVIEDILSRLQSGETLRRYPARLRAADGSIRYVEITSSALFREGEFVNTRCFTVDVSELHHAREETRHRDEQFRQVLDSLPAALYMTDAAGKITYYNNAAVELAGREPVLGEDAWCVSFRLHTADGKPLPHEQCPMAISLKENRPVRGIEALAERPDGTLVPFLPFPTPIHDANGELVGAVNLLVDLSDRKESEANQRVLLDELNHRVKNNMQMLYALISVAQRETDSPEARAVLANASQRIAAMAAVQRLLYSDSHPRSFSIGEFLDAVCQSARQAFGKEIDIRVESENGTLSNALAMPLALILNELLTNAAKHGVNARGAADISVVLRREDSQVVLSVEDDGPGFEMNGSRRRSSGLGLVNGLARQLRGTFAVERGAGARCVVRFPETSVQ